eukprot:COSAG01_NODE_34135_length_552_cov_6.759382_1_plen_25_part_01
MTIIELMMVWLLLLDLFYHPLIANE